MAIEKIALENIKDVVENDKVEVSVHLDPVTATAYEQSVAAAEHVEEVTKELEEKAVSEVSESTTEEVPVENMYTKKLTLDESIDDFRRIDAKSLSDVSDEDLYLDYDMFDFVYGLVTDDWPKPKNPLNHPMRKFMHTGSDDYMKTDSNVGVSQVSTDIDGNVVVYSNAMSDFNDLKEACDYYHLTYHEPRASRNSEMHWNFSFTINVPMTADGYPMMAEDFFAQYGMQMSDVIENHKISGKEANWGVTYHKNTARDRKQAFDDVNDRTVERIFDKYVVRAANSNDPLEGFINDMFSELDQTQINGTPVVFSKTKLKKNFLKEFEDDFEDEE